MRNSRVIALVLASFVSTASLVEAQAPAPRTDSGRQEMRGMKGKAGRAEHRTGRGGLMKGITLSEAEKAQLRTIRAKYRTEGKALRTSLRPAMQEVRAARLKGDTAGLKALRTRNAGSRTQVKALHDRQRAEIRAALTVEHQKQFDANVAELTKRRAEWAKNRGEKGRRGEGKRGHRGHRAA